jgi:hypothetical protein
MRVNGIWVMSIHRKHRSRDQRLKTKVSTRKLALHGALLDEGFSIIGDHCRWAGRYSFLKLMQLLGTIRHISNFARPLQSRLT